MMMMLFFFCVCVCVMLDDVWVTQYGTNSTNREAEKRVAFSPSVRGEKGKQTEALPFSSSAAMGRVNKERLAVLLDEVRSGKGAERYRASLQGRTSGTSSASSAGNVRGIQREKG